jgi:hypothetical protein
MTLILLKFFTTLFLLVEKLFSNFLVPEPENEFWNLKNIIFRNFKDFLIKNYNLYLQAMKIFDVPIQKYVFVYRRLCPCLEFLQITLFFAYVCRNSRHRHNLRYNNITFLIDVLYHCALLRASTPLT